MFSLARQAAAPHLGQPAAWTRYLSSKRHNVSTPPKSVDPGLEQRRAARLAREAAGRSTAQKRSVEKKSPNQVKSSENSTMSTSPMAKPKGQGGGRPRKPSLRDHLPSSPPRGGTERSRRTEVSKFGAAEAIMAISQRGRVDRAPAKPSSKAEEFVDSRMAMPKLIGPEPVARNITALLNTVPNLVSCLPSLPSPKKLRGTDPTWIKQVYSGDYSKYQLDTSSYMNGTRGPASTYAKIILSHNRSVSLESQRKLIEAIQRVAK